MATLTTVPTWLNDIDSLAYTKLVAMKSTAESYAETLTDVNPTYYKTEFINTWTTMIASLESYKSQNRESSWGEFIPMSVGFTKFNEAKQLGSSLVESMKLSSFIDMNGFLASIKSATSVSTATLQSWKTSIDGAFAEELNKISAFKSSMVSEIQKQNVKDMLSTDSKVFSDIDLDKPMKLFNMGNLDVSVFK
jgi:hypothetical protein